MSKFQGPEPPHFIAEGTLGSSTRRSLKEILGNPLVYHWAMYQLICQDAEKAIISSVAGHTKILLMKLQTLVYVDEYGAYVTDAWLKEIQRYVLRFADFDDHIASMKEHLRSGITAGVLQVDEARELLRAFKSDFTMAVVESALGVRPSRERTTADDDAETLGAHREVVRATLDIRWLAQRGE